ncbi:unnamed protein product, partial [Discosporangium mesarthrocarpum]
SQPARPPLPYLIFFLSISTGGSRPTALGLCLSSRPHGCIPSVAHVAQVPKDMDEEQLRPLFEQAGPIAHIMVIRDRQTDAHRGCAFLTYHSRAAGERAVEKFHNKLKLPNVSM